MTTLAADRVGQTVQPGASDNRGGTMSAPKGRAAAAGGNSLDPKAARAAHDKLVAEAKARIAVFNERMEKGRAKGVDKALQRAATRFLAPGEQLRSPAVLDLVRWPNAGDQRVSESVPLAVRDMVLEEDAFCRWCTTERSTTVDHVHPLSRGGTNHPLNLVGACEPCNSTKADFMPVEIGWRLHLPLRFFSYQRSAAESTLA